MEQHGAILRVKDLRKYFPVRGGLFQTVQAQVKAYLLNNPGLKARTLAGCHDWGNRA
jgi:hypothetical protein